MGENKPCEVCGYVSRREPCPVCKSLRSVEPSSPPIGREALVDTIRDAVHDTDWKWIDEHGINHIADVLVANADIVLAAMPPSPVVEHLQRRLAQAERHLAALVRGCDFWASDEDGVHPDAFKAYQEANSFLEGKEIAQSPVLTAARQVRDNAVKKRVEEGDVPISMIQTRYLDALTAALEEVDG